MKTDKKKLMRKLIAVGLMASMLTANTMTYCSSLILPSINAEALTISEAGATTYDISTMVPDENTGIITINIDANGTYIFTGTNLRNAGTASECYIDVQVNVAENVVANFIFDALELANNSDGASSGAEYKNNPFVIAGTVNLYIKSDSSIKESGSCYRAYAFYGEGTLNIMESDDNASLSIPDAKYISINVNGGNLKAGELYYGKLNINDGCISSTKLYINDSDTIITGGYAKLGSVSYPWLIKNTAGDIIYQTSITGLPENMPVTKINETELSSAYTDENGEFHTYLPDLSNEGIFDIVVDGTEYLCIFSSGGTNNGFNYEAITMEDIVGTYKFTKTYDGTTALSTDMASGEFELPDGVTLTPDFTSIATESANAGESTVTVPAKLTINQNERNIELDIPVEITAKELTATITANNKVYDFSAEADVKVTFEGLADGDTLTEDVDYTITAEFADENVGTGKTVTATITLADTVKNYTLENTTYETTADITAAPLTITGAAVENKTYDGEKTAKVTEVKLNGVIDGDVVDYTSTAEFADEKIGTDKAVTVTVKLADTVKNYTLEKTTYETTADIIAKGVTIADVVVESKTYDGKTDATVTSVTFKNEKGEVIPLEYEATAAFTDKAAGKGKEVTVTVTLKDSTYTLAESKFTAKADINYAGKTENVSYESVEDKPSLPNADNFVDKEVNGEGLLVVKSPKTETRDYYFAYLVKNEKFKIGNAAPKTGTFYVALNDKGEKTRKFTVSIPFTTVIIDGKTYKAPDGYAYYAFGITDVPTKYDLHCSENIELN